MSNPTSPVVSRPLSPPPSVGAFEPQPPPYVRCLHWSPRRFAAGDAPPTRADLVFTQPALKRMREHATAFPDQSVLGLLLGRVSRDPAGDRPWVQVEEAVRAPHPTPEDSGPRELAAALEEAAGRAAPGRTIVGWYRSHRTTGLFLSEEEAQLHEARFPEPWQCAVVLLGTERQPTGGVFQTIEGDGLIRGLYTPFYELLEPSSELPGKRRRTFAGWGNYEASGSIVLAGRDGVSAALPPTPAGETATDGVPPAPTPSPARTASPSPRTASPKEADADPRPASALEEASPAKEVMPAEKRSPVEETSPAARVPPSDRSSAAKNPPPGGDARLAPNVPRANGAIAPAADPGAESGPVDSEEAWERRQIQRTLSAVGRTLGPAALGELGSPTPPRGPALRSEEAEPELEAAKQTEDADTDSRPRAHPARPSPVDESVASRSTERVTRPDPLEPTPAPSARASTMPVPQSPAPSRRGGGESDSIAIPLVGRSRRRSRLPIRKAAIAAVGLLVLAGGGWAAARLLGGGSGGEAGDGDAAAIAQEEDGAEARGLPFAAAIGLPTGNLLRREGEPPGRGEAPRAEEPGATEGGGEAGSGDAGDGASTVPRRQPTAGPEVAPVTLDDPVVAAYENALVIFRKEAAWYDEVRRAFDEGLEGCNALNLAYRGVGESFVRLERRFEDARQQFAGPALRAFESAGRARAVIDRHYELTSCPPPVGG